MAILRKGIKQNSIGFDADFLRLVRNSALDIDLIVPCRGRGPVGKNAIPSERPMARLDKTGIEVADFPSGLVEDPHGDQGFFLRPHHYA